MGKSRRPRGPRPTWEPKIVGAAAPEAAGPGADAVVPAFAVPPETETSERALMAAADPAPDAAPPEPTLPATVPAEAVHPEPSAFEAAYEAASPDPDPAPPAGPEVDAVADPVPAGVAPAAVADVAPVDPAPTDLERTDLERTDLETDLEPAEASPPEPAVAEPAAPLPVPAAAAFAPVAASVPVAGSRIAFDPERFDMVGIGDVIAGYVRGETQAAAAHMRALTDVRSPADLIRLNVGEIQRAADASLTCWTTVARKAGRVFSLR